MFRFFLTPWYVSSPLLMGVMALAPACGGQASDLDPSDSGGNGSGETGPLESGSGGTSAGGNDLIFKPCPGGCEDEDELDRVVPGPRPECPDEQPTEGSSCSEVTLDLSCSYGEAANTSCRTFARCVGVTWQITDPAFECHDPEDGFCPNEQPEQFSKCTVGSHGSIATCQYPTNVTCACGTRERQPGDASQWGCVGPPSDPRCPVQIPNAGEGCDVQALQCTYAPSACEGQIYDTVFCYQGQWEYVTSKNCL